MIHHLVFRGILQDDPFFFVEKVERRYGTHAVEAFSPDDKVLIEAVVPFLRIYRHIVPPRLHILVDIDVHYCKKARFDHVGDLLLGLEHLDDAHAGLTARIAEEKKGIRGVYVMKGTYPSPAVRKAEIGRLCAYTVDGTV